jgi:paired small multidrug resistance pump
MEQPMRKGQKATMASWLFLVIASSMETGWLYAIQGLSGFQMDLIYSGTIWQAEGQTFLFSLVAYILLGVGNAYFFYKALQTIPSSVAFGVWTGLALGFTALVESLGQGEAPPLSELIGMGLILLGIIGLKEESKAKKSDNSLN